MVLKVRKPNRGRRAEPRTLVAPTGGLNGRDNFTAMDPKDAFVLDNWFPNSTDVETRGGSTTYLDEFPGAVETLAVYTGGDGSKLLAFSSGGIYDITAGVLDTPLETGRVSNRVCTAMFSNAGSQFLLIYSGADEPLSYDGTTTTGLVITGAGDQDTLFCGHAFKGRMYLGQLEQLGFYYLGIGAIQGAASYFDLQQQSLKGGALAAIASVSFQDSGTGPQDYMVFATSEGEYILYAGTDPSNAATWQLVGRYIGPPPIGKNGWFKFRSDVYFITVEGILSLTQIRQMGEDSENEKYITAKLGRIYTDAAIYKDTYGWQGALYPRGSALMVNAPMSGSTAGKYQQFVMNTNTNAWCRYTGWNGLSFALMDGVLYFGTSDGRVMIADSGFTDQKADGTGAEVIAVCRQAWNDFEDGRGMGEANKQFHAATFAMQAEGAPALGATLNVNYENQRPTSNTPLGMTDGAEWDVAEWDVAEWAGTAEVQNVTIYIGRLGYVASLWMQASSLASKIRWFATRLVIEKTKGVLLQ